MNQIFYNNTEIRLSPASHSQIEHKIVFTELKKKGIFSVLKDIEEGKKNGSLLIEGETPEKILEYFRKNLTEIIAAGGLIQNSDKEILFIFRNDKWDLPKGKPEGAESTEETALREVEEECGISALKIVGHLPDTYHIYPLSPSRYALKRSIWFHMYATVSQPLKIQREEGITEARWVQMPVSQEILSEAFPSIRALVEFFSKHYLRGFRS
ncbi:MAG: NUDIX hydrolase [Bacteroidota bacterium]